MTVYAALSGPVPKVGVILLAALAAAALLTPSPRQRVVATGGALVLAPVLLLADIWHSPQVSVIHRHPAVAVAAALIGLVILAALAAGLVRRPWALGPLVVVALPFRVPIDAGGTTS